MNPGSGADRTTLAGARAVCASAPEFGGDWQETESPSSATHCAEPDSFMSGSWADDCIFTRLWRAGNP